MSLPEGWDDNLTSGLTEPVAFAKMHAMSNEDFGYLLQTWHGGGGSALYAMGSSLGAGHDEVLRNQELVQKTLKELRDIYDGEGYTYADRIETLAMADELRYRSQNSGSGQPMEKTQVKDQENWVLAKCKFAQPSAFRGPGESAKPGLPGAFRGRKPLPEPITPAGEGAMQPVQTISDQEVLEEAKRMGIGEADLTPNKVIELKRSIQLKKQPSFEEPTAIPTRRTEDLDPVSKNIQQNPRRQDPWRGNKTLSWVERNCKFAMPPQRRLLSPQELEPLYQQIANALQGIAHQDQDPTANYNAVRKQVEMRLKGALQQNGQAVQNLAGAVDEILQIMGVPPPPQQRGPAPMQQNPQGAYEDPGFAAFRQSRQ